MCRDTLFEKVRGWEASGQGRDTEDPVCPLDVHILDQRVERHGDDCAAEGCTGGDETVGEATLCAEVLHWEGGGDLDMLVFGFVDVTQQ